MGRNEIRDRWSLSKVFEAIKRRRNNMSRLCILVRKFNLMDKLYCAYQYDGIVKEMIHQYKFMKDVAIAEILVEKIRLPHQKYDYCLLYTSPSPRD